MFEVYLVFEICLQFCVKRMLLGEICFYCCGCFLVDFVAVGYFGILVCLIADWIMFLFVLSFGLLFWCDICLGFVCGDYVFGWFVFYLSLCIVSFYLFILLFAEGTLLVYCLLVGLPFVLLVLLSGLIVMCLVVNCLLGN